VAGLAQRAKQVARDEHNTEQQHAFVKPAGHAPFERRCLEWAANGRGGVRGLGCGWGVRARGHERVFLASDRKSPW
jgi:hypothetical protein